MSILFPTPEFHIDGRPVEIWKKHTLLKTINQSEVRRLRQT